MISGIQTKGSLVAIHNITKPYISPGSQSAGMIRFNTNSQQLEVYDGVAWLTYGGTCEIGLTGEVETIIEWAREKMLEEQQIDELCKKYPGLRKAKDNYELFKKLAVEESIQSS